jgi:peptidoglycan/LPS O-acetylase OafA/YrhL
MEEPGAAERLDSVQVLRAIAAVAVAVYHAVVFGFDGTWGVDLFFVISGFIMCHVTSESARHFLLKRAIRVVPLYWVGTIGVYLVALAAPSLLNRSTASPAMLLQSLAFIPFDKGNGRVQPLLFLGWTLNYEVLFYVLFTLAMALHHARRGLLCAGFLGGIVLAGALHHFSGTAAKFYTNPIILEFALGMLAYRIFVRTSGWRADPRTASARLSMVVLGLGVLALLPWSGPLVAELGHVAARGVPAAVAFLLITTGASGLRLPRPLTLIGDASYSLYLFHPYVIVAFERAFHAFSGSSAHAIAIGVAGVALCGFFAVLCWRFVERPLTQRLRELLIDRRRDLGRPAIRTSEVTVPK